MRAHVCADNRAPLRANARAIKHHPAADDDDAAQKSRQRYDAQQAISVLPGCHRAAAGCGFPLRRPRRRRCTHETRPTCAPGPMIGAKPSSECVCVYLSSRPRPSRVTLAGGFAAGARARSRGSGLLSIARGRAAVRCWRTQAMLAHINNHHPPRALSAPSAAHSLSSAARSLAPHKHTGSQVSEPHLAAAAAACLLLFSANFATSVRREAAEREQAAEAETSEKKQANFATNECICRYGSGTN